MEKESFKSCKRILLLDYPTLPPTKSEKDYRLSKQLNTCILGATEWDMSCRTADLDLLYAKREYRNTNEHLTLKRMEAAKQFVLNNNKLDDLAEKQHNLRASFIKFEQFVLENDEKRRRARRKIKDDKLLQVERTRMLERSRAQHILLSGVKGKLDLKTKEYRIYEDFLNNVVLSMPEHYKTIQDVMKRHGILVDTKNEVATKRGKDMDALDQAKAEYEALVDKTELAVVMLNSQLVQLIVRHERAQSKALMWENIVIQVRDIIAQKQRELSSVHVSLWNIYKMICARKNLPRVCARSDFSGQLMFVKKSLFELNKICQILSNKEVSFIAEKNIQFHENL